MHEDRMGVFTQYFHTIGIYSLLYRLDMNIISFSGYRGILKKGNCGIGMRKGDIANVFVPIGAENIKHIHILSQYFRLGSY